MCGEALGDTALAGKGEAEQPLGVGESRAGRRAPGRSRSPARASRSISTGFQSGLDLHRCSASWTRRRAASPRSPRPVAVSMPSSSSASASAPLPRLEQRVAELDLDTRTLARVGDPELERGREPGGALGEGPGRERRLGRAQVVVDGALDAVRRGGEREVVGELGQDAARIARVDALERLADAEVELGAADAGDPVVDGAAHELVREAAGGRAARAAPRRSRPRIASSSAASKRALVEPGGLGEHAQLEPRPGDGRELEQRGRLRRRDARGAVARRRGSARAVAARRAAASAARRRRRPRPRRSRAGRARARRAAAASRR